MAEKRPALAEKLKLERELRKDGLAPRGRMHLHDVMARHSLDQDLGYEDGLSFDHGLDQETQDRLLAHARQDAALAVATASAMEKKLHRIELLIWIAVLSLAASMFLAWVR